MQGLSLTMIGACASGTGSVQLTLTLLLAAGLPGYAQAPPDSQPKPLTKQREVGSCAWRCCPEAHARNGR